MSDKTRIYLVSDLNADENDPSRHILVDAANQAQAIRHVVRKRFIADVATQRALVDLTQKGVEVERASAES